MKTWVQLDFLVVFLLIYCGFASFALDLDKLTESGGMDMEESPTNTSSSDYNFEEVLNRHKRQCACLSQYTPVNCKCQQADPTNTNDLSCRCDRATVSPQCSCAPAASTLCFPVCQQQCIQSCVAQQQSVPQCQPPCQLICQRACQSLPAAPVYATLQPLQISGQTSQPAPLAPLPIEPNGRVIYAIPQAPNPLPHATAPPPPSSNAQSIGQATVYLPTQAQCIPLCTEQCMKNCPNSPGQCAQTCTNGCHAACSRQPLQVNQPGPVIPLQLPQQDQGCISLCRPDCSPKCTRQFVDSPQSSGNLVLAQVGNRDTASNKQHRAPTEIVLQAPSNDFEIPPNTRTIFESEYFIPLDGRSNNIVIPIPLPNQPQLEINLSQGPAYATAPKTPSSDNGTKSYEVPTQMPPTSTTTEQPQVPEQSISPEMQNNDNHLRAAMTATNLPPLQLPGYQTFQQPAQQTNYSPAQIAAYYQQLLSQLAYVLGGQQTSYPQNGQMQQSQDQYQQQIAQPNQQQPSSSNNFSPNAQTSNPSSFFNQQQQQPSSSNNFSPNLQTSNPSSFFNQPPPSIKQNQPSFLQSDQQPPSQFGPSQQQWTSPSQQTAPSKSTKEIEKQEKSGDSQQKSQNSSPTPPRQSPPNIPSLPSNSAPFPFPSLMTSQSAPPPGFVLSNSYMPQQSQMFVSPYAATPTGQLGKPSAWQQQSILPKSGTSTRQYSPRRLDHQTNRLYGPPIGALNDTPGEIRLDIQWPGQSGGNNNSTNCTGNQNPPCVQQYNKGFRVTASEAQSFFKHRFSRIKASAAIKRKDTMMEFDEQPKRVDSKQTEYMQVKQKDNGQADNMRQRRPISGSGRVQKTDREECQDSCRQVCNRACDKHRLNINDYTCSRRCVEECSQRCPSFKHM